VAVHHPDPAKVALAHDLHRRYPPDPDAAAGVPNVLRTGTIEWMADIPDALTVDISGTINDAVGWVQDNLRKGVPIIGGTQAI